MEVFRANERARLAVLAAVAASPLLLDRYVLKGGLALCYAYGSPRPSADLDFGSIDRVEGDPSEETAERLRGFCAALNSELERTAPEYGYGTIRVFWQHLTGEMPGLWGRVGYSLEHGIDMPDDFEPYIEMQVTLGAGASDSLETEIRGIPLHVPTLESVLAEKLKALLQQPVRNVERPHDLYDLWFFAARSERALDRAAIASQLLAQAAGQPELQPVTAARFRDGEVRRRACAGFEDVKSRLLDPAAFVPCEEAFQTVLRLVDQLGLRATL